MKVDFSGATDNVEDREEEERKSRFWAVPIMAVKRKIMMMELLVSKRDHNNN